MFETNPKGQRGLHKPRVFAGVKPDHHPPLDICGMQIHSEPAVYCHVVPPPVSIDPRCSHDTINSSRHSEFANVPGVILSSTDVHRYPANAPLPGSLANILSAVSLSLVHKGYYVFAVPKTTTPSLQFDRRWSSQVLDFCMSG